MIIDCFSSRNTPKPVFHCCCCFLSSKNSRRRADAAYFQRDKRVESSESGSSTEETTETRGRSASTKLASLCMWSRLTLRYDLRSPRHCVTFSKRIFPDTFQSIFENKTLLLFSAVLTSTKRSGRLFSSEHQPPEYRRLVVGDTLLQYCEALK